MNYLIMFVVKEGPKGDLYSVSKSCLNLLDGFDRIQLNYIGFPLNVSNCWFASVDRITGDFWAASYFPI